MQTANLKKVAPILQGQGKFSKYFEEAHVRG